MSGRYIRCSATVSVTTGTTLELGARIAKKHAPRNPTAGRRMRHHKVAAARPASPRALSTVQGDGTARTAP